MSTCDPGRIGSVVRDRTSTRIEYPCRSSCVGLLIGRWLSTWLESLVFGVEAGSWTTAMVAVAASLIIMIGAALIPARRAVRLQPSEALRVE